MGVVIDTSVIIEIERGRLSVEQLSPKLAAHNFIAAVTVSETLVGVHLTNDPILQSRRLAFAETIIARITALPFDNQVARTYSRLQAHFLRHKQPHPGIHDLQIAATALTHGHRVLTCNSKDFVRIPDMQVDNPLA